MLSPKYTVLEIGHWYTVKITADTLNKLAFFEFYPWFCGDFFDYVRNTHILPVVSVQGNPGIAGDVCVPHRQHSVRVAGVPEPGPRDLRR